MCIASPTVTPPSLGGGLSLEPPGLPSFSGSIDLCCKTVPFATPDLPLGLPIGSVMYVLGPAIAAAATAISAYLDAITPKCPLE